MYKFVREPFQHQVSGMALYRGHSRFGFFDEQGCGKSKMVVDASNLLFLDKALNAVVVICPNTVKSTWANEEWGQIAEHTPSVFTKRVYRLDLTKRLPDIKELIQKAKRPSATDGPLWLIVNYEAVRQGKVEQYLTEFISQAAPVSLVLDESTRIKNSRAIQTKAIQRIGRHASRRYILTGTPMAKNPLDLYAQMNFLDPSILRCPSFVAFRSQYAVMGGFCVGGKPVQIVGWKNLDKLQTMIAPYTRVVKKEDVLPDLPEKLYTKIEIPMTPEQEKAYLEMKAYAVANLPGTVNAKSIAAITVTKLLRMTQITSGFLSAVKDGYTVTQGFPANPKEDFVLELLESTESIVCFCVFKHEIEALARRLQKEGISAEIIHGDTPNTKREERIKAFQDGNIRVLVCQVVTGGIGITLTRAHTAVYMSNAYSYESRAQSEDRLHRPGQKNNVIYYDLLSTCQGKPTIDHTVLKVLKEKKDLSDALLGQAIENLI